MVCTCVVGLQWGDEAKGKIVDILTEDHDFVIRYNGGANAGHTVVHGGKAFKLSLLPTGILRPNVRAVVGNGVVIYPPRFFEEVERLSEAGVEIGDNLLISNHAHVIFPYHLEEERLNESSNGQALGTTGRGIGPCYKDKVGRQYAVRLGELLDSGHLRSRLDSVVEYKNRLLSGLSPKAERFEAGALADEYLAFAERMRPHVTDTTRVLHEALGQNKRLLFEAAQGSLLDVDHGSYPYVTSSNSSTTGISSGSGVSSRHLTRVVGILKAYTTRVGNGPFPTELDNEIGDEIRNIGKEFGTVTGRPRRCGWFDAVAARYTATLAGVDEVAVMLLDVLSTLPELCIATGYEVDGEKLDWFPGDAHVLDKCKPTYETMSGWQTDITGVRRLADLPANARRYLDRIGELVEKPVSIVSVGPDREQTILE